MFPQKYNFDFTSVYRHYVTPNVGINDVGYGLCQGDPFNFYGNPRLYRNDVIGNDVDYDSEILESTLNSASKMNHLSSKRYLKGGGFELNDLTKLDVNLDTKWSQL